MQLGIQPINAGISFCFHLQSLQMPGSCALITLVIHLVSEKETIGPLGAFLGLNHTYMSTSVRDYPKEPMGLS